MAKLDLVTEFNSWSIEALVLNDEGKAIGFLRIPQGDEAMDTGEDVILAFKFDGAYDVAEVVETAAEEEEELESLFGTTSIGQVDLFDENDNMVEGTFGDDEIQIFVDKALALF